MPRQKRTFEIAVRPTRKALVSRLVDELKSDRAGGQPVILEQEYSTKKLRVLVIWDEWDRLILEDRTATILKAYELAEGVEYRDRVALATGVTVPEAHASGMLPFSLFPALRKTDPVTADECRRAMIDEGASVLFGPDKVMLRFMAQEEAEAAQARIVERLPASEPVWVIAQDVGRLEGWAEE